MESRPSKQNIWLKFLLAPFIATPPCQRKKDVVSTLCICAPFSQEILDYHVMYDVLMHIIKLQSVQFSWSVKLMYLL